jgi:hypothetical protein
MTLHILCIAYERPIETSAFIASILAQSCPDWKMTIVHDGAASPAFKRVIAFYPDPRINFIETEVRQGNWGHENRKVFLQLINGQSGDFVLITNGDNYYTPNFIKYTFRVVKPGVKMVFCDFLHHNMEHRVLKAQPRTNFIDMGAFFVEIKLAQEIGFRHDVPASDGLYCEECYAAIRQRGWQAAYVDLPLFVHN